MESRSAFRVGFSARTRDLADGGTRLRSRVLLRRHFRRHGASARGQPRNCESSGAQVTPRLAFDEDVADAIRWMVERGMPALPSHVFSPTGLTVDGLASCWLYATDSSLFYLEMLVSNPAADLDARRAAQDAVIKACIAVAKRRGASAVLASVSRDDVVERLLRLGAVVAEPRSSVLAFTIGGE